MKNEPFFFQKEKKIQQILQMLVDTVLNHII